MNILKRAVSVAFAVSVSSAAATATVTETDPAFHHDLKINGGEYELRLDLSFSKEISLEEIERNLKDGKLLAKLGSKVKDIVIHKVRDNVYDATTVVKSWGFTTKMVSRCRELSDKTNWARECRLDTEQLDASKYMVWKRDSMRCERRPEGVKCKAQIVGEVKPFTLLGFELISKEKFAASVKAEAIENFKKLWSYTEETHVRR
ncbi:MAG: hypothetical protein ABL958_12850 [Bdellovibrionia bacterium]